MAHVGQKTALGAIGGIGALARQDQLRFVAFLLGNLLRNADDPNQLAVPIADGRCSASARGF